MNFDGNLGICETKSEIRARIEELKNIVGAIVNIRHVCSDFDTLKGTLYEIDQRIEKLNRKLDESQEDLFKSIVDSHKALCAKKQMGLKEAYGQNPALFYTMGMVGEAGECANKIVKALRNGDDSEAVKQAVISELPDVIIYAAVLAFVLDLDLTKLVNEKAKIVVKRAEEGYYGGPLPKI